MIRSLAVIGLGFAFLAPSAGLGSGRADPIRAAYFYQYMTLGHLDSLAAAGFNRALIKWITDSLETRGDKLRAWVERGEVVGIEVTPVWTLQARARLRDLPTARRYAWSDEAAEPLIGCPLDSLFWASTLIDRAEEFLAASPGLRRLAVDLEIYFGKPGHYDPGPCRCGPCQVEFDRRRGLKRSSATGRMTLEEYQTERLARLLESLLREFAHRHPGIEMGVFDLDLDSFVHRAFARALKDARVSTVNYTERTYAKAAAALPAARAALRRQRVSVPLVGGLWLRHFSAQSLRNAVMDLVDKADGYFVFTTYSLWREPEALEGAYRLSDQPSRYWAALKLANQERSERR